MLGKIQEDLKQAQLAKDEIKVSTLRLLISEIHNAEIQKGGSLSDQDTTGVIQREVKKRKEAAAGFRTGGREDSAQKEEAELKILEGYLPKQLSNEVLILRLHSGSTLNSIEGLTKLVEDSINEVGAKSLADMGKVMGMVMSKVKGQADGNVVSGIVKEKLSK